MVFYMQYDVLQNSPAGDRPGDLRRGLHAADVGARHDEVEDRREGFAQAVRLREPARGADARGMWNPGLEVLVTVPYAKEKRSNGNPNSVK